MDVCLNQSLYPIKHWGSSPFGACPKAKRHTSFPFCECGGTMSWRTPCPGAVEENKEIVNTCSSVYSIYLCVIYMQVCPCGLFMLMPWAALLKHNESCAEF